MRRTFRMPILILLPLLLVAGLIVESSSDESAPTDVRVGEITPTAAAAGTLSSTWYCAAGTATGLGTGDAEQRVIVANASDTAATGTMTLYPEGAATVEVPLEVAPHSRSEVVVSQHVVAPWAAALVEVTGGEITVAHSLTGPTGRSLNDCASSPSGNWYFPGGSTAKDASLWLALFNPFPGEATIDLAFDTPDGARTPQDYQGLVVPGGSVVVKKVSDVVTLNDQMSTTVSARSGRVVAEQVQAFGPDGGRPGLAATLGATDASPIWSFPTSAPVDTAALETVAVFNPGDTDTEVVVQVQLDDPDRNGTVEPFEISVPAHRYASVTVTELDENLEARVPRGVPHWIVVRTPDGSDVVAQRTISLAGGGLTTSVGLPVVATRWLSPVALLADTGVSQLAVANPSPTETATISVRRQGSGAAADVTDLVDLQVAPGERVVVNLGPSGFTGTDSVEVTSDVPVVVGQWLAFTAPVDVASPLGVPVAGTQSVPEDVVGPTVSGQISTDDLAPTETFPVDSVEPDGGDGTADGGSTDGGDATTTTTAGG